jgi:voltage-gated potassium channel Kch
MFDPGVLIRNTPAVAIGVAGLILIKALTLATTLFIDRSAPTATHVSLADSVRLSVLLAGGGEFAFVVLASAQNLGLTPGELNGILTTIVLISMAITPLLGDVAENLSAPLVSGDKSEKRPQTNIGMMAAPNSIVICGYGEVGSSLSETIGPLIADAYSTCEECSGKDIRSGDVVQDESSALPSIVCFDLNPSRLPVGIQNDDVLVVYGDGANQELVRSIGVTSPGAFVVTYSQPERRVSAVQRLRLSFPDAPIYARAASIKERDELVANGASAAVSHRQALVVQLGACLFPDESEELATREKAAPAVRCVVESLRNCNAE